MPDPVDDRPGAKRPDCKPKEIRGSHQTDHFIGVALDVGPKDDQCGEQAVPHHKEHHRQHEGRQGTNDREGIFQQRHPDKNLGGAKCTLPFIRREGKNIFFNVAILFARPSIVAVLALVLMETSSDFRTVEYFALETLTL